MYEVLSLASVKLLVELIIRCCCIIFALALVSEKEVFLSVLNCGFVEKISILLRYCAQYYVVI